jgi:hypothetical protein
MYLHKPAVGFYHEPDWSNTGRHVNVVIQSFKRSSLPSQLSEIEVIVLSEHEAQCMFKDEMALECGNISTKSSVNNLLLTRICFRK